MNNVKKYTPSAFHVMYECKWSRNISNLDEIVEELLRKLKFNIVDSVIKKFVPHGETIVWILEESHCSIHTYPEYNYFSFDLYTCDMDVNVMSFLSEFLTEIKKQKVEILNDHFVVMTRGVIV